MKEIKENISIKRVHDNNKYVVTRTIIEEMNLEEIDKTTSEIRKGLAETRKNLSDIPKQAEARTLVLKKEADTLQARLKEFEKHSTKEEPEGN